MASREKVESILAEKLVKEGKRLKSCGEPTSVFSLARAVAPNVQALMTYARWEEVTSLLQHVKQRFPEPKRSTRIILKWLKEREKDLVIGKNSLANWADQLERDRPWKFSQSSETVSSKVGQTKELKLKRRKKGSS